MLLPAAAGAAAAQTPPAASCSAAEHRQLDFWVGDWDLTFDAGEGRVGRATNRITADEFGDCVIAEHFEMADTGYVGGSWSFWTPRRSSGARRGSTIRAPPSSSSAVPSRASRTPSNSSPPSRAAAPIPRSGA